MEKQADKIVQTLKSKGLQLTPQRFALYPNQLLEEKIFILNQQADVGLRRNLKILFIFNFLVRLTQPTIIILINYLIQKYRKIFILN